MADTRVHDAGFAARAAGAAELDELSTEWGKPMNMRAICEGRFTLPLPATEAVPLFTPEGERRWAGSSWDAVYPIPGAAADDATPGTVFTTDGDGGRATWIVLEHRSDRLRYARVAADLQCRNDRRHVRSGRIGPRDGSDGRLRRHMALARGRGVGERVARSRS